MSYLIDLYEVFEKNKSKIGKIDSNNWGNEVILLPISHTTQTAHIEVNITEDGQYHSAKILTKNDKRNTIIPCTLESASRSSNITSYPLHDKLSYVAGDFVIYVNDPKKREAYADYIKNLSLWVASTDCHWKVKTIFQYVSKGSLIKDLINDRKLFVDENNLLIEKWNTSYEKIYGYKPDIFSVVSGSQSDAFVRFNVYSTKEILDDVWYDQEVADSYIKYYNKSLENLEHNICYVTGKKSPITKLHANKIRNAADKSKLVSSNDESGFTYRGRFETANQAASLSYEASQKAHNALKWLISLQGETMNGRVYLIWGITLPLLLGNDPLGFSSDSEESSDTDDNIPQTEREYAYKVNKAIKGYRMVLDTNAHVNILILDAATTGRLAVTYYQKLHKHLFLDRLEKWFSSCIWCFRERDKKKGKMFNHIKTPNPWEIATATYGSRDDKLIKQTIERILICMLDHKYQEIPKDIERSLIIRASSPTTMENWEWEKCLSVACAVIKNNKRKQEEINMALELENKDRSYLFGRLLAVADVAERTALKLNDESRDTNAMRYMTAFSNHPEKTWKIIREQLHPYLIKLGKGSVYFTRLIDEITDKIGTKNFNNVRLDGKYLVGLSSQRLDLYKKKQDVKENQDNAVEGENEND